VVRAGDALVNSATGLRTVFRETSQTTKGELLQVDWITEPGWTTGPDHVHPYQEERFEVLSGVFGIDVGGAERVHGPGEAIVVPAGSPHRAWNAGDGGLHLLVDFRPALRTELAFESFARLANAGLTTGSGVPRNPLRLALLLREFEDEFQLARPPARVQGMVLSPLATLGRFLGFGRPPPPR
jgi:quercetin dioxygenase-like cupin family protein